MAKFQNEIFKIEWFILSNSPRIDNWLISLIKNTYRTSMCMFETFDCSAETIKSNILTSKDGVISIFIQE